MVHRLQKQPVLTYIAGVKAVAAKPTYCETYKVVIGYGYAPASIPMPYFSKYYVEGASPVYQDNGDYTSTLVGYTVTVYPNGGSAGSYSSPNVPIFVDETRCYPAVVGVAGTQSGVNKAANNGWNAGARSVDRVLNGSYTEIAISGDPLGIVVGLADGDFNSSYGYCSHALVARPSGITPVEHGLDVGSEVPLGSKLRLSRYDNKVVMSVDGINIYRSDQPVVGDSYLSSVLYSLSDYVEDPVSGRYYESSGESEVVIGSFVDPTSNGTSELSIETEAVAVLDGVAYLAGKSTAYLVTSADALISYKAKANADLKIESTANGYGYFSKAGNISSGMSYAQGYIKTAVSASFSLSMKAYGVFSPAKLSARMNRPEADPTEATGLFSQPLFSGNLLNGALLSAEGSQYVKCAAGDAPYFGGKANAATHYRLIAWESYLGDNELDGSEMMFAFDSFDMQSNVVFAISEGVTLTDHLDIYLLLNIEAYEGVSINSYASLAYVLELIIAERIAVSSSVSVVKKEALQYAVNMTTGALSRYQNFGFKQFATSGGKTYAITDSAIYVLSGKDDAGSAIDAAIDFGASDYGTAQLKRVSSVYAGIATDGEVYIRVSADEGDERIYKAFNDGRECRVTTGKGVSARHWRIRLELADASYADLDNTEIEIGVSQRRLRGSR